MAICGGGPGSKCISMSCLLMMYPGPMDEVHPTTKLQLATKKRNDNARRLEESFNSSIVARIPARQKEGSRRLHYLRHFGSGVNVLTSAATDTNKSCAVMISRRLARPYFFLRLVVVHSAVDPLNNLFLRQAGIFQTRNLGACKRRLVLKAPLQQDLHR